MDKTKESKKLFINILNLIIMRSKITWSLIIAFFLFSPAIKAQTGTLLYNFESGTTQLGTWAMGWPGANYITSYGTGTNPETTGINSSATSLNLVVSGNVNWWDQVNIFTLTSPTVLSSSNRYLHVMMRTSQLGDGYSVNLNTNAINGIVGKTRFDGKLSKINTWQDVVVDLDSLISHSINLTQFCINPYLTWGSASNSAGTYNFDEILLNNNPLPRGTTFLAGNNLYDFEPGTSANITGINTSSDAGDPVTYPVANPFQTGINLTANVGKRTALAGTNWWTGFAFTFVNPVLVDASHKYLHVMITVPVDGQPVAFDVQQGASVVIGNSLQIIKTANTWQDAVIDVSGMVYISAMSIKCGNWTATAAGDYYFDEIYIDGNSTPRGNVATGLQNPTNKLKVFVENKNICIENVGSKNAVNIFNCKGQNILNKQITNNEIIPMKTSGLYFVKVGTETTKVLVQ